MTIKPFKVLGALLLLGLGTMANAASVNLVPTSVITDVAANDIVTFDVVMDFTGDPTLGGGFDIMWDEGALALVSVTPTVILGDPSFGRVGDYVPGSGLIESTGVGDFNGLTTGLITQLSFEVLAGLGAGATTIALGPTAGIAGPWVSAIDFVSIIEPDYGSQVVTGVVPVPAAVWFMLSGLGALFGMRRSAA